MVFALGKVPAMALDSELLLNQPSIACPLTEAELNSGIEIEFADDS